MPQENQARSRPISGTNLSVGIQHDFQQPSKSDHYPRTATRYDNEFPSYLQDGLQSLDLAEP